MKMMTAIAENKKNTYEKIKKKLERKKRQERKKDADAQFVSVVVIVNVKNVERKIIKSNKFHLQMFYYHLLDFL